MSLANYRTISRPPISNQPITKMGRIIADENGVPMQTISKNVILTPS
ncbi:hypothetical protein T07_2762 [Trichinella nelsoni]|uniref:Uncharacterized protein n=1 Tax=Trichinella nelsoni TaxID=6336 RepID=A0A0V0RAY4_9BILA|nr:hypothetical protein T07_2762 [Trichinella nelsoni]